MEMIGDGIGVWNGDGGVGEDGDGGGGGDEEEEEEKHCGGAWLEEKGWKKVGVFRGL